MARWIERQSRNILNYKHFNKDITKARKEILEKLTPIFTTAFNDETIELSEDMTSDDFDNWDSVTLMIIVSMIEKEFDIVFKLREVGMLDSVEAFVDGIAEKLA